MNDTPLVSIVVPMLNAERFLAEAVASTRTQTFQDWELILVDDGSTDRSAAIARGYAHEEPGRIRYLEHARHRTRGASTSRNLGIDHARGAYIAFLDADDVWLPQKLQHQVAILESHPDALMLYGPAQYWYSWTGDPADLARDYVKDQLGVVPNTVRRPPELLSIFVRDRLVPCPTTVIVRRDAIRRIGGFEDRFRRIYTDQVFFAKLCLNGPVFVSGECWARYRVHPESCSRVAERSGARESARLQFLEWLRGYLASSGLAGPDIWRLVATETHRSCDRVASQARVCLGSGDLRNGAALTRRLQRHPRTLARHCCPRLYCKVAGINDGIRRTLRRMRRRVSRKSTGRIVARPNPIEIDGGSDLGTTSLTWRARATEAVEVRVGAPDGPLLSRGGASGHATTGPWVNGGLAFYLQDASGNDALIAGSTIDVVKVRTTANIVRCALRTLRTRIRQAP